MSRRGWLVLAALLGLWGGWSWWHDRPVYSGAGIIAADEPLQQSLSSGIDTLQVGEMTLTPRARFNITARVLSIEAYRFDRGASISPLDFAVGWGPMSDSAVLAQMDISQSGRFFRWRTDSLPIPRKQIETHAANIHLIPADETVRHALDRVRVGEVIELEGYLVDAADQTGWRWNTSLRRDDTGNGACELLYVDHVYATL